MYESVYSLCVCVCVSSMCVSMHSCKKSSQHARTHTQLQFYERVTTCVGSVHANGSLCGRVCVFGTQGGWDVGNSLCHQVLATCNPIWAVRMCSPLLATLRLPGAPSATCAPLIPPLHEVSRWLTHMNTRRGVSAVNEVKLVPERREMTPTVTEREQVAAPVAIYSASQAVKRQLHEVELKRPQTLNQCYCMIYPIKARRLQGLKEEKTQSAP